ncbi:hypothetical protein FisN_13Lu285 [Fistulifera solaris]|uniref:Uncharacterized protein n=1 Tax=Fistulifera solaris TaxID=1519565 RepID=A0A1Z5KLN8_FISSO|nr:hypothetical protein FisN_13Lu285 [Fistulifera solaris]|eukprot:GAX27196.1 hypothetical protein FisN_13Lu285 [Fistulifera solaris]
MNPSLLILLITLQSTSTFMVLPFSTVAPGKRSFYLSDRNVETNGNGSNSNEDDEDCDEDGECEIDWDAMPTAAEIGQAAAMRKRLEMSWQLEEAKEDCNVDQPQSCGSEPCQDCSGKGWKTCRFCRGTKLLFMPGADICQCKICHKGRESCRSCQGTGWVAGWTQLQETAH